MKNLLRIGAIITAIIATSVIQAEDITDDYNTGDTLTANTLENIKSAVNSKQDRINGVCPPGQSIGTINADGSVICETDDDTNYSAGTGLDLTGTEFKLSNAYLMISGAAFVSEDSINCPIRYFAGSAYFEVPGNAICVATAPVPAPPLSTLISITCYLFDNTATGSVGTTIFNGSTVAELGFGEVVFQTASENGLVNQSSTRILGTLFEAIDLDDKIYLTATFEDTNGLDTMLKVSACRILYSH